MLQFLLKKHRNTIDKIDKKIIKLLTKRGNTAIKIAEIKSAIGSEIYDPYREKTLLEKIYNLNKGPFSNKVLSDLYTIILRASRGLQVKALDHTKYHSESKAIQLSVQGIEGSFSEQVAINYCNDKMITNYELHYAVSSKNVVSDVLSDRCEFGIVAMCNNWGGVVDETVHALKSQPYHIRDTYKLMVKQNLLVLPNTTKNDITNIYSHEQALAQCRKYLSTNYPHAILHEVDDTAQAAKNLSQGLYGSHSAVIAAKPCSDHYGLYILEPEIQDNDCNETLFLIITRK